MRDKEQQAGAKKPKVKAAALRIQKGTRSLISKVRCHVMVRILDLSDLDMNQYPTMKLIFADTPGQPQTLDQVRSPGQHLQQNLIPDPAQTSSIGQTKVSGQITPDTPSGRVTPEVTTPNGASITPATPVTSVGTPKSNGRSGSGGPDEFPFNANSEPTMTKEEEEKRLHFKLEITPDDGTLTCRHICSKSNIDSRRVLCWRCLQIPF